VQVALDAAAGLWLDGVELAFQTGRAARIDGQHQRQARTCTDLPRWHRRPRRIADARTLPSAWAGTSGRIRHSYPLAAGLGLMGPMPLTPVPQGVLAEAPGFEPGMGD
jgi:hypothetical protein